MFLKRTTHLTVITRGLWGEELDPLASALPP